MTAGSHANEFRLTRVYDAPMRAVWDAWTNPAQVEQWWGPRGFTLTTHARDLRPGGVWRFTMHGPDGVDYPNVTRYLVVEPPKRLVYDHGGSDEMVSLFQPVGVLATVRVGFYGMRLGCLQGIIQGGWIGIGVEGELSGTPYPLI